MDRWARAHSSLMYVGIVAVWMLVSVSSSQQDFIPPREMVFSALQVSYYAAVLMGVVLGADSISGARERSVLESLLPTPASRSQILVGKFLGWRGRACATPTAVVLARC